MNTLINTNSQLTMTTTELLKVINTFRKEQGESEVRANDFLKRVQDELEGENYESFVVQNINKTESLVLSLNKDQCFLVAMRESKAVRKSTLEHLKKLEVTTKEQGLNLKVIFDLVPSAIAAAEAFGFVGNQAKLSADKAIKTLTGNSPLLLLGIELVKEAQVLNLTPTQIGKELNPPLSAIATNKLLASLGFQEKLHDQWVPTSKGKAFAIFLDTGKKHSDGTPITQLKWLSTILPQLS